MPLIQVSMLEGRTVEQKRAMIAAITDAVAGSLGAPPDSVRVIINELHPEHYGVGGRSAGAGALKHRKLSGEDGA